MKTTAISLILILLAGTLATPVSFSEAQVSDLTVPNPPTNLNATAVSSTQINLSWTAPVNSTEDQVNGYKIEIRPFCTGSFSVLVANTTNTTTAYSNTDLASGICYEYQVSALNPVGTGNASNTASATTWSVPNAPTSLNATPTTLQNPTPMPISPPTAPTGLTVTTLSGTALKLTWNVPSDTGGAPITGYSIQRNGTIIVNNTGNSKTNYTNSGLLPLHQQTYRVAAWNIAGLGPYSNNATGTTNNQTSILSTGISIIPTSTSNLGQQVSSFVHQYNDLFKMQRDLTIKKIKECNERLRSATLENRIQVRADCKADLKTIKEQFKDLRKQFKEDFKVFRDAAKSLIKAAKQNEIITTEDAKGLKKELKISGKEAKKELREDIKEIKKEIKQEEKQFKKELMQLKKQEKEHKKELKKETKKAKKDKHDDDDEDD